MIKRIYDESEFSDLPKKGVEAQKIRSLFLAYGSEYDFCRFYRSELFFLAELSGSFVLCEVAEGELYELSAFLGSTGCHDLFCTESAAGRLLKHLDFEKSMLSLMEYNGNFLDDCVETNPPLQDVFSVLSTSFDIDFEPWYLDMSHRVRHGVSEVYRYEKSVLAVQYNINGEALISQVATVTEYRGRGYASKLLSAVCGRLSGSEVFILCEDKLVEFYRKIGFVFKKNYCQLNPRRKS